MRLNKDPFASSVMSCLLEIALNGRFEVYRTKDWKWQMPWNSKLVVREERNQWNSDPNISLSGPQLLSHSTMWLSAHLLADYL